MSQAPIGRAAARDLAEAGEGEKNETKKGKRLRLGSKGSAAVNQKEHKQSRVNRV